MKLHMYAVTIGHYRMTHHGCTTHLYLAPNKQAAENMAKTKVFSDDYIWDTRNIPSKRGFVDLYSINRAVQKAQEEKGSG